METPFLKRTIAKYALCLTVILLANAAFSQAPTIKSFSDSRGLKGSGIWIEGTNFTGATAVSFGGVPASSFTVYSSNLISAIVDTGASGSVSVVTPNGTASKDGFIFLYVPAISSFSPESGSVNTLVTIRGTHFTNVYQVQFGNTHALSFNIQSDTLITAIVGAGSSGSVAVASAAGFSSKNGFTHFGPVITSYSPLSGADGTTVTINGTNFINVNSVTFGGLAASSFSVVSSTQITAVPPAGSSGTIAVATTSGTGYARGYNLPQISSFSPQLGGEGTEVTIKGRSFTAVNKVSFGKVPAKSFLIVSDTVITAVTGAGDNGLVKVENSYGGDSLGFFSYKFLPPTITSFAPASAREGDTVTIKGSHFTGVLGVQFNFVQAKSFKILSDTALTAVVGAASSGVVYVYGYGGNATAPGFTYVGATISSFTPSEGASGDTIQITGTNLSNAAAVSFGGTPAGYFKVVSPQLVKAVVGSGSPGYIEVATPMGTATSKFTFSMKPVITSFVPTTAGVGDTILIKGRYFKGAYYVAFGGTNATSFSVTSDSTIDAVVGNGSSGNVTVAAHGTTSLPGFVLAPKPRVDAVSPSLGGANTTIRITGFDFTNATSVTIGGVDVASFTVVDNRNITAVVGAGATGTVVVKTAGGNSTGGAFFTYFSKPQITSFTPSTSGPATLVIIRGKNLNSTYYYNNGSSQYLTVKFGNQRASVAVSISDTVIEATVGSGASGQVYVETPGGKDSVPGFVFKPVPTITTFSPVSGPIGTTVTISGTNFSAVASDNIVFFGGVRASIVSATANSITATVPAGATFEPLSVTVNNLSAYANKPFVVTYPGASNFSSQSFKTKTDIKLGFKPRALFGDVNGDGMLDMVASNIGNNTIEVFSNRSSADSISFAPKVEFASCPKPFIYAIKDFDGDGKVDVLLSGDQDRPYVMLNKSTTGTLFFLPAILIHPYAYGIGLKVADFNSDGRPDIVAAPRHFTSMGAETVEFWLNDFSDTSLGFRLLRPENVSNGLVENNVAGGTGLLSVTDLNGDKKPDLIVGLGRFGGAYYPNYFTVLGNNTDENKNYLWISKTHIIGASGNTWTPRTGDLNGDDLPDILNDTIAYLNTGNFSFTQQKNTCTGCVFINDMDGDGKPDLATYNKDSIGIVRNSTANGKVSFGPKISFYTGAAATSDYAFEDINGDGKPEIIVSRAEDNTISILHNKVGQVLRLCPGGSTSITSNIRGENYRWQQSTGGEFTDITDNATFSGTNTQTLLLNAVADTAYGYKYRCITNPGTSYTYTIEFENSWHGAVSSAWETAGNWACSAVPNANTDVVINSGNVVVSTNVTCRSITLKQGATLTVMPGVNLTISR